MPIRPENRSRYPKDWATVIVPAVRARSGDKCECAGQCGLVHEGGRCNALNYLPHPSTGSRVVLTVAHRHGVELESRDLDGMFHACQQCHNRYDAPMRRAGIQERARAALGIPDMFASNLTEEPRG